MKQFNLTQLVFDDLNNDAPLKEGWIAIRDPQDIDKICETITGGGKVWLENGKLQCSGKAPSEYHIFNMKTKQFELSEEKRAALLLQRKENTLALLANRADQLKNGLLVGYPQTEIESFYRQEKEALAWQLNHETDTPMLTQIARLRGVPFEILVEKVIEKSNQFAVAIGMIIGQRQKFEDRLLVATTIEQLDELEQEINEWQFQAS